MNTSTAATVNRVTLQGVGVPGTGGWGTWDREVGLPGTGWLLLRLPRSPLPPCVTHEVRHSVPKQEGNQTLGKECAWEVCAYLEESLKYLEESR